MRARHSDLPQTVSPEAAPRQTPSHRQPGFSPAGQLPLRNPVSRKWNQTGPTSGAAALPLAGGAGRWGAVAFPSSGRARAPAGEHAGSGLQLPLGAAMGAPAIFGGTSVRPGEEMQCPSVLCRFSLGDKASVSR